MLHEPPIDELTGCLGEEYNGSKYALCVLAAKRARQLVDAVKSQNNPAILNGQKPLTEAACEIYEGKITVSNS